ncbi:Odorant receptor 286 [Nylanderia fulva]|uniref:Odorant receptor n=1 Tax=Nylanderia fulva TaxID=613905 RepID=A0A6G1LPW7_9HYME|nr:uncharacterized protein LOC114931440 [Nylanderia fulva]KAF3054646.1 Odorant receptor 286 [Nylanderia fulva]
MRGKLMLRKFIFIIKLSLFPALAWPLSKDVTRLKKICVQLYHYLGIILAISVQVSLVHNIVNHFDDVVLLVVLILFLSGVTHSLANFIFHRIYSQRIQYVTFEMIHFSESIQPHEDVIIKQYIDRFIVVYGMDVLSLYVSTLLAVIAVPFLMDQPFPMPIEYPFNVYNQPLRTIIYLYHSVVGIHVAAQTSTNILMGLLLWVISARLEILANELRKTTDIYHLVKCIKKHQYLLKCATEISFAVRPFAFTTICCSTIVTIIVLLFLSTDNLTMIYQYTGLIIRTLTEIFMYTWPAESLIETSQDVAETVFQMPWYNQSIKIRKILQIIIQRSRKPITISIPCVMSALSLNYFTSYFSTIVSYFKMLRMFLND